jgi:hypothetical protein
MLPVRKWSLALCRPLGSIFLLTACSLQFDNPVDATLQKILKPYPVSFTGMVGRWVADSTYTLQDARAMPLGTQDVELDFHPDSTFFMLDTSAKVFPPPVYGSFKLIGDSISLRPDSASAYPAKATLRFLGNYLEIYLPQKQRIVAFHKSKAPDSLNVAAWLDSLRWMAVQRRDSSGPQVQEPLRSRFEYLIFSGDSLIHENNQDGIYARDSGTYTLAALTIGTQVTEQKSGGIRSWLLQWVGNDSLRFWPLGNGKPDSGFVLYARTRGKHPFDLDCSFLPGYWRGDSLLQNGLWRELDYGYFFDLGFDSAHHISVTTNTADLPRFESWDIDSGRLLFRDPSETRSLVLNTAGNAHFGVGSVTTVPEDFRLRFTLADSSQIRANPISRFSRAPYARVAVGSDTLNYFWYSNYTRISAPADLFELFGVFGADTLSLIAQLPEGNQTYSSSLAAFDFGFAGETLSLGRFTCFSAPSVPFALRLLSNVDPTVVPGTFQGACKVSSAEKPAGLSADSTLEISGDFRFRFISSGTLKSPLWSQP